MNESDLFDVLYSKLINEFIVVCLFVIVCDCFITFYKFSIRLWLRKTAINVLREKCPNHI